jgi:hypothetical protein
MGYSIPVSISDATAQNPTSSVSAGTVINFGANAAVRGDVFTTENSTDQRPTATSSASTGGAAASETAIGQDKQSASQYLPVVIAGVVAFGVVIYLLHKQA